jgi:hypothetical protein
LVFSARGGGVSKIIHSDSTQRKTVNDTTYTPLNKKIEKMNTNIEAQLYRNSKPRDEFRKNYDFSYEVGPRYGDDKEFNYRLSLPSRQGR